MLATLPKTTLGKWSIGLIAAMPILFIIGGTLAGILYTNVPAGDSILQDLSNRPVLALSMLLGMISGVASFITGLLAVIKQKENSLLVNISVILGFLLILFLIGEFAFPH